MEIKKIPGVPIPEGGESLYCEAGLLPLNRYPESENTQNIKLHYLPQSLPRAFLKPVLPNWVVSVKNTSEQKG